MHMYIIYMSNLELFRTHTFIMGTLVRAPADLRNMMMARPPTGEHDRYGRRWARKAERGGGCGSIRGDAGERGEVASPVLLA